MRTPSEAHGGPPAGRDTRSTLGRRRVRRGSDSPASVATGRRLGGHAAIRRVPAPRAHSRVTRPRVHARERPLPRRNHAGLNRIDPAPPTGRDPGALTRTLPRIDAGSPARRWRSWEAHRAMRAAGRLLSGGVAAAALLGAPPGRRRRGRRRPDRHRRHRLAAHGHRPGHGDAARARPVLRRPGAAQERPLDDHAQLLRPGPRQRRVGARRLQPGLRAGRRRLGRSSAASTSSAS